MSAEQRPKVLDLVQALEDSLAAAERCRTCCHLKAVHREPDAYGNRICRYRGGDSCPCAAFVARTPITPISLPEGDI